jgi:HK97 gp10 family phage protein
MGLNGLRKIERKAERLQRDLEDEVADAAEDGAEATQREAKRNVVEHNTVWRGNLFRSIVVRRTGSRIRVLADVPYAAVVEYGSGQRGDPSAPFDAQFGAPAFSGELVRDITDWVFTKPAFYGPRTVDIAQRIASTIADEGTYAHPYMRPAWFKTEQTVIDNAERAVRRALRR